MKKIFLFFVIMLGFVVLSVGEKVLARETKKEMTNKYPILEIRNPRRFFSWNNSGDYYITLYEPSNKEIAALIKASLPLNPGINPDCIYPNTFIVWKTEDTSLYDKNFRTEVFYGDTMWDIARMILESPFFL
jgi:hypothetical protein